MAYANATDPHIHIYIYICIYIYIYIYGISGFWFVGRNWREVRPRRKRRWLHQFVRDFSLTYFQYLQASWSGLETYFSVLEAFWRSLAWLGDGFKPSVASQTILRHLGSGSEASWRRFEGILEASSRRFGGGLGLPGRLLSWSSARDRVIVDFLLIFSNLKY